MKHLLLALLVLAVAPTVEAQYESAYYGLSLGEFDYEASGGAVADTTNSYRLMVGYQFMEHLTVEGGWGQTGDIKDSVTFDSVFGPPLLADFNSEFEILTIRLLGVLPFDNGLSLLGGLGYADSEEKITLVNTNDPGDRIEQKISSNDPTYYVAAQYDWDRLAIRLGYEKYDFDGDLDVVETSVTFFYKL
jgi:predicted porin